MRTNKVLFHMCMLFSITSGVMTPQEIDFVSDENLRTEKTTLIVTSSPNSNELESLKKYVESVMPMLLSIGGKVIKRAEIRDSWVGEVPYKYVLVMEFPDKRKLKKMLKSKRYKAIIPYRDKGFSYINILFADDLYK